MSSKKRIKIPLGIIIFILVLFVIGFLLIKNNNLKTFSNLSVGQVVALLGLAILFFLIAVVLFAGCALLVRLIIDSFKDK